MKTKILFFILCIFSSTVGSAKADRPVGDEVRFGRKDANGVDQVVHIKPFKVNPDCLMSWEQRRLKEKAEYDIKSDFYFAKIGETSLRETVDVYFQDGEIKSQYYKSTTCPKLYENGLFVQLRVGLAFENKEQAETGIYTAWGIVKLITGEAFASSDNGEWLTLWDNDRNKRRDPVFQVGMHTSDFRSPDSALTVGSLKRAMGPIVEVVYPD